MFKTSFLNWHASQVYLQRSQTPMIELFFAKIVNGFYPLKTNFEIKNYIGDFRLVSRCALGLSYGKKIDRSEFRQFYLPTP